MLKDWPKKLKDHFANLRQTIAPMPFKKKVEHIWIYYKEIMFTIGMVILILFAIISSIANSDREVFYAGSAINMQMNIDGYDYLTVDFLDAIGADPDENIQLINNELDEIMDHSNLNDNYYGYVQVETLIAGDNLHYLLMDQVAMEFYGGRYLLMDLREILTEEEMKQWEDRIFWVTYEDDEKLYPLAVNIAGTEFAKECLDPVTGENVYIGFGDRDLKIDLHRQMWEHIQNWKSAD